MPLKRCRKNGLPGYKWGDDGTCYTYKPGNKASREAAKHRARLQGKAIRASGFKE